VTGYCEYGDERLDSGSTDSVNSMLYNFLINVIVKVVYLERANINLEIRRWQHGQFLVKIV
jgi:hypothetical protein